MARLLPACQDGNGGAGTNENRSARYLGNSGAYGSTLIRQRHLAVWKPRRVWRIPGHCSYRPGCHLETLARMENTHSTLVALL